jgi:hypothetical protein
VRSLVRVGKPPRRRRKADGLELLMKRRSTIAALLAVVALVLGYRERRAQLRNDAAREFIEALIPRLDAHKVSAGVYPEAIPLEWYDRRSLPELLRPDFYMTFEDGQEYLMRFQDPRSDPRFWWGDIVAHQSNIGYWAQWDGY